jgi:hypothetical protein
VKAKVDIVTSQNISPTALPSHTWGIGISLLYLSQNIERLAGDIPPLPTPLMFDLYKPVNLIIASNGSILLGVGYHRWVLETKDETILLDGGGMDDVIQFLMTSYRSDLGGIVTRLAVPAALFRAGTIHIQSVLFLYSNDTAVTGSIRPKSDSIFHNTKYDLDLIMTIQDPVSCDGVTRLNVTSIG